ncbi:MAG TPA: Uma2 family endonuclease [Oscillatoriales cyanobacterium M4454_W2019_049]|nr:Uma2 family endonuclease [Oscillatoriales cyanobacterium M4454_W2019_049]
MIAHPDFRLMTPQAYLRWEAEQPIRYEYIDGEVFAMSGGTVPHNQVAVNLVSLINSHLRGKGCKVLSSDAKVRVAEAGPFHYPDVSVTCDDGDRLARQFICYPCLIAEVLSPSTEAFDQGKKFTQYRRIPTLREYLIIDPDNMSLECYRLNDRGNWELFHDFTSEDLGNDEVEVELKSLDLRFPLSWVYENITFLEKDSDRAVM